MNSKKIELNEVNIAAQTAAHKLALAKQKLISSQKDKSGTQAVADALANNILVTDKAKKDLDLLKDSIKEIDREASRSSRFSLSPIGYSISIITLVASFSLLGFIIRRRKTKNGVPISAEDDLSFDELLKKIKLDNLNREISRETEPLSKPLPKKRIVKKSTTKKAAVKKSSNKKSATKKAAARKVSAKKATPRKG